MMDATAATITLDDARALVAACHLLSRLGDDMSGAAYRTGSTKDESRCAAYVMAKLDSAYEAIAAALIAADVYLGTEWSAPELMNGGDAA